MARRNPISDPALVADSLFVSTARAAQALGVSVSSVKRWVDDGVLPAHKTAGGHRKLLAADVLELARRGELPHADLSQLLPTPRKRRPLDLTDLAARLHQALLAGDAVPTRAVIHGAYRRGIAIEELADRVIGPCMVQIGHEWETDHIDVMEEHRASQLCAAVLHELKPVLEARGGKDRPLAVGGAPEGDYSVLPSLLAQMVLLDAGWEAVNLGPNTPFASFARAIADMRPRLLWLSVSHRVPDEDFIRGYKELYKRAEKAGVAVAIGGRALGEKVRAVIPYTTHGDGLTHLAAFARTLHPPPAQPRRGRPKNG